MERRDLLRRMVQTGMLAIAGAYVLLGAQVDPLRQLDDVHERCAEFADSGVSGSNVVISIVLRAPANVGGRQLSDTAAESRHLAATGNNDPH